MSTIFCDNDGCIFSDGCGFCDCDKLSIVDGVCEGSYSYGRNASDDDERLKAENAKLRKLVLDTLTTISWCTIDCYPSDNKKRELNARARELGIEVES